MIGYIGAPSASAWAPWVINRQLESENSLDTGWNQRFMSWLECRVSCAKPGWSLGISPRGNAMLPFKS